MAQIGTFKRTKAGISGRIRTLALDAELVLIPVDKSDAENAPDYRIHLGDDDGAGRPGGWSRLETHRGEGGRLYLLAA